MATIVLQVVGAAIGGAIGGPVGATIGRAVGAAAGYAIDQKIFTKDQVITGPRLDSSRYLSSNSGAPIPRVYGRVQIGGQIIWATRFEEMRSQTKQGGKGGPKTRITQYSYFGNFAVGLCAGPVSRIARIWADGTELDLSRINLTIHYGKEDQQPDPLIEGLQTPGNTPAYRGLAYVVFEDFPLATYGNRIPQLTFEVIRVIGKLESSIKSVCLIPGSTAFGYSPTRLVTNDGIGGTHIYNRHTLTAKSDWAASLDELQALCPNLESVSLVVSWFGNDLRAQNCQIMPGVERVDIAANNHPWSVSGTTPANAHLISRIDDNAAFGSTPSDQSVIEAIEDLHARGLKVTFYPFIMMDIESNNNLPDPYGAQAQAPYPWRGEITCDPAIGQPLTADRTAAVNPQINAFSGTALPTEFIAAANTINFTGTPQWTYRRMILHYAHLCNLAGGVENFIIGSELKTLTRARDDTNAFPFVGELQMLASDVTQILGPTCNITYAADWSEYFGYHPQDGSNDLYYNLDPLWASSHIHAIGIDNYMPLADWRSNGDPLKVGAGEYDIDYFQGNIAGGEGFDWYYANVSDRNEALRTPITDGAGEPWVWRYKDLKSWWSMPHHERINGIISPTPTSWIPRSKPFWFTELGCPAINKGANQPNVFSDPKSSQSAIPHFSNGHRDELMQRNFLQAHFDYWQNAPDLDDANPQSDIYTGRMIDDSHISVWAWDTRPFPAFPMNNEIGSDRNNWTTGHWLNGRLGGCRLDELVSQILHDHAFTRFETARLSGWLDGFVIPAQAPLRQVLEPLLAAFGASAISDNGKVHFTPLTSFATHTLDMQSLVEKPDQPLLTIERAQLSDLPAEAIIHHDEIAQNIRSVASKSKRIESHTRRQLQMQLPALMPSPLAQRLADNNIHTAWVGRENLQLKLPPQHLQYSPGDILHINDLRYQGLWQIVAIEEGFERQVSMVRRELPTTLSYRPALPIGVAETGKGFGRPLVLMLDIPAASNTITHDPVILTAITAEPWAGDYTSLSSPQSDGFEIRALTNNRATIARLMAPLSPGPQSRWDYSTKIRLSVIHGQFDTKLELLVLNGANALAVQTDDGQWELMQYQTATLENDGSWTLSNLLRAQLGTEIPMSAQSAVGNYVVLLDQQINQIKLQDVEKNLPLQWRTGPSIHEHSSDSYHQQVFTFRDRAAIPLSPVHLGIERAANDDLTISWIRRSRIYGDDWNAPDIPLGEAGEAYRVTIFDGANVVRELETTTPVAIYTAADQQADFTALPQSLTISVSQLDAFANPGTPRTATFTRL